MGMADEREFEYMSNLWVIPVSCPSSVFAMKAVERVGTSGVWDHSHGDLDAAAEV